MITVATIDRSGMRYGSSSSSREERTMDNPFVCKTCLDAMKPIMRLKRFSGRSLCWPPEDESKNMHLINTIIDFVITVFVVSYSIHCIHFFFHPHLNTSEILIGLVLVFFYIGASLLSCINIVMRFTTDHDLIRHTKTYRAMSGRDLFVRLERTNSRLLWMFLASSVLVNVIIATLFQTSILPKESILVRILMFTHHDGFDFTLGVFSFSLISFFIQCGQFGDFWSLAFFYSVFNHEFRFLYEKWLRPRTKTSNNTSEGGGRNWQRDIDIFRKEYEQVVRLVKAVERTIRFDLLLYFGVIIPVSCVFIYVILQPEEIAEADLVVIVLMACVNAVQCGFIIFVGVKINSIAHELTEDLYNVDMTNMPSNVISKISIFLTRLTASPIGISVAGLFIIDNSTILMLAGTLLTYVVVVIQTKPTSNKFHLSGSGNCSLI